MLSRISVTAVALLCVQLIFLSNAQETSIASTVVKSEPLTIESSMLIPLTTNNYITKTTNILTTKTTAELLTNKLSESLYSNVADKLSSPTYTSGIIVASYFPSKESPSSLISPTSTMTSVEFQKTNPQINIISSYTTPSSSYSTETPQLMKQDIVKISASNEVSKHAIIKSEQLQTSPETVYPDITASFSAFHHKSANLVPPTESSAFSTLLSSVREELESAKNLAQQASISKTMVISDGTIALETLTSNLPSTYQHISIETSSTNVASSSRSLLNFHEISTLSSLDTLHEISQTKSSILVNRLSLTSVMKSNSPLSVTASPSVNVVTVHSDSMTIASSLSTLHSLTLSYVLSESSSYDSFRSLVSSPVEISVTPPIVNSGESGGSTKSGMDTLFTNIKTQSSLSSFSLTVIPTNVRSLYSSPVEISSSVGNVASLSSQANNLHSIYRSGITPGLSSSNLLVLGTNSGVTTSYQNSLTSSGEFASNIRSMTPLHSSTTKQVVLSTSFAIPSSTVASLVSSMEETISPKSEISQFPVSVSSKQNSMSDHLGTSKTASMMVSSSAFPELESLSSIEVFSKTTVSSKTLSVESLSKPTLSSFVGTSIPSPTILSSYGNDVLTHAKSMLISETATTTGMQSLQHSTVSNVPQDSSRSSFFHSVMTVNSFTATENSMTAIQSTFLGLSSKKLEPSLSSTVNGISPEHSLVYSASTGLPSMFSVSTYLSSISPSATVLSMQDSVTMDHSKISSSREDLSISTHHSLIFHSLSSMSVPQLISRTENVLQSSGPVTMDISMSSGFAPIQTSYSIDSSTFRTTNDASDVLHSTNLPTSIYQSGSMSSLSTTVSLITPTLSTTYSVMAESTIQEIGISTHSFYQRTSVMSSVQSTLSTVHHSTMQTMSDITTIATSSRIEGSFHTSMPSASFFTSEAFSGVSGIEKFSSGVTSQPSFSLISHSANGSFSHSLSEFDFRSTTSLTSNINSLLTSAVISSSFVDSYTESVSKMSSPYHTPIRSMSSERGLTLQTLLTFSSISGHSLSILPSISEHFVTSVTSVRTAIPTQTIMPIVRSTSSGMLTADSAESFPSISDSLYDTETSVLMTTREFSATLSSLPTLSSITPLVSEVTTDYYMSSISSDYLTLETSRSSEGLTTVSAYTVMPSDLIDSATSPFGVSSSITGFSTQYIDTNSSELHSSKLTLNTGIVSTDIVSTTILSTEFLSTGSMSSLKPTSTSIDTIAEPLSTLTQSSMVTHSSASMHLPSSSVLSLDSSALESSTLGLTSSSELQPTTASSMPVSRMETSTRSIMETSAILSTQNIMETLVMTTQSIMETSVFLSSSIDITVSGPVVSDVISASITPISASFTPLDRTSSVFSNVSISSNIATVLPSLETSSLMTSELQLSSQVDSSIDVQSNIPTLAPSAVPTTSAVLQTVTSSSLALVSSNDTEASSVPIVISPTVSIEVTRTIGASGTITVEPSVSMTTADNNVTGVSTTMPVTTTTPATTTPVPTTTPQPTTQNVVETYWLAIVLKVPMNEDVSINSKFGNDTEQKLAELYEQAYQRQEDIAEGNFTPLRRRKKRFTTPQGVTAQVHNITRKAGTGNVTLGYTIDFNGTKVPATQATSTLSLLSDQEMAIKLGYVVAKKPEPYVSEETVTQITPPEAANNYWVIGVAVGSIVLIIIIIFIIFCLIVKSKKTPGVTDKQGEPTLYKIKENGDNTERESMGTVGERATGHKVKSSKRESYEVTNEEDPLYAEVRRPKSGKPYREGSSAGDSVSMETEDKTLIPSPHKGKKKKKQRPDTGDEREHASHSKSGYLAHPLPETGQYSAEEEEELQNRKAAERKKNKQRIREKRKKEKREERDKNETGEDDTIKQYLAVQEEIDQVLDAPPQYQDMPDVFKNKSKKRSKKKAKSPEDTDGEINEAFDEQPLTEAKKRMHKLLDDAFALISPTLSGTENDDREELTPSKPEKLHEPMYINPSYTSNEKPALTTWSPYRASDQVALISMPKTMQTTLGNDRGVRGGKRPVANLSEAVPKSKMTKDSPKPIILRTRDLIQEGQEIRKSGKNYVDTSKPYLHNGFGSHGEDGVDKLKSSHIGGKDKRKSTSNMEMKTLNGDSLASRVSQKHQAPNKRTPPGDDVTDVVSRSIHAGQTPDQTIKSVRDELQGMSSSKPVVPNLNLSRKAKPPSGALVEIA